MYVWIFRYLCWFVALLHLFWSYMIGSTRNSEFYLYLVSLLKNCLKEFLPNYFLVHFLKALLTMKCSCHSTNFIKLLLFISSPPNLEWYCSFIFQLDRMVITTKIFKPKVYSWLRQNYCLLLFRNFKNLTCLFINIKTR